MEEFRELDCTGVKKRHGNTMVKMSSFVLFAEMERISTSHSWKLMEDQSMSKLQM